MKRFLTNLILIISILSILVVPSFAATTSDSDDIVILKQPSDTFWYYSSEYNRNICSFSIVVLGDVSYQWQRSLDNGDSWHDLNPLSYPSADSSKLVYDGSYRDVLFRCELTSNLDGSVIYSRVCFAEYQPTNLFNFVTSCLRYITSYISLIINSLVTPGAPLYALLPVLCIGIAVAALLIVIKIIKGFSWGT